jgi:hypothetical protein
MKVLSKVMRECFQFFLDDYPLVIKSLYGQPFESHLVCERAMVLADLMEVGDVPPDEEWDDLTRAIFKASIEKSDWLSPFEDEHPSRVAKKDAMRRTMRQCATFLEGYGIEIDFIPI